MQRVFCRHPRQVLRQHEDLRIHDLILRLDLAAPCHVRLPDQQEELQLRRCGSAKTDEAVSRQANKVAKRIELSLRADFAKIANFPADGTRGCATVSLDLSRQLPTKPRYP